ncbi:ATP-binding cassette sub-family A member 3-like [Asterias rubens]|uniref:ATP-binding cassette sub-family A member 3-like n=1 Tax=Asterias rubens TaxID=7604 RepID=UPI0014550BE2|nr:ATP-binding cassette sub-family A member 3-like [Asterias rubens]
MTYSIRLSNSMRNVENENSMSQWQTEDLFPFYQVPGPRNKDDLYGGVPAYYREGFLTLQNAIDMAVLQFQGASLNHATLMQRYPYPPYFEDLYVIVLQSSFPDLIMVSLVLVALNIAKSVTYEKEKRLKESMKMMGLSNWVHWSAWFIKYFIYLIITVSLMTMMFCIKVGDLNAAVVTNSDPSIIFVFLMLYAVLSIMYSFAISSLFSKANSAAVAAGVFWFISYMPYYFLLLFYQGLSLPGKIASCLISNTAMGLGAQIIALFEGTGEGIQWDTINKPFSVDDDFTLLQVMMMMVLDIILYGVFTWYVEAVFPGEFGVPLGWNFFLKPSYWCGSPIIVEVLEGDGFSMQLPGANSGFFEEEPTNIKAGIQIRNLSKVFKNKSAVNNVSMNMYKGQITVLLGHNGAGKTTTMSMLTGFIPPTSGTAFLNGCSIRGNLEGVRSSLGLCPQHDVLYDDLTVEEHLYFFGKLKGLSTAEVKKETEHYIEATGLQDKRKQYSKSLSGGMKRKLSVAIALIADSKVVMLDEPTSGMDPDARRSTWDLLENHRDGRTILLTTHHMDEADLLGDRIAIMAEGELQCFGTSLFLKKKYGVGYHMVMVKSPQCNVNQVADLIHSYIPTASMESNVGAELSFILPNEASDTFEALFTHLEENKKVLGISSYGASITTMEEVFIKVGENSDSTLSGKLHHNSVPSQRLTNGLLPSKEHIRQNGQTIGIQSTPGSTTKPARYGSMDDIHKEVQTTDMAFVDMAMSNDYDGKQGGQYSSKTQLTTKQRRNTGLKLYLQQFRAMLVKHILHSRRNVILASVQLCVPLLNTAIAVVLLLVSPQWYISPPLIISATPYKEGIAQFSKGLNFSSQVTKSLGQSYLRQFDGTGTQVVDIDEVTSVPHNMRDYLVSQGQDGVGMYNSKNLVSAAFEYYDDAPIIGNISLGNVSLIVGMAFYNNQPYHTSPLSLNAINNAYARYYLGDQHNFNVINDPLPATVEEQFSEQSESFGLGSMIAFTMVFGMSFLASSFGVFLIMEANTNAKHLQIVSGVHAVAFWFSKFIWDLINYMIPCVLIGLLMLACRVDAYALDGRIWDLYLLLFLHGWAVIPFSYLLAFFFKEPASGYVRILIINIALSMLMYFTYKVLSIEELGLTNVAQLLDWIFMLMPLYSLGAALEVYYIHYTHISICLSFVPYSQQYCDIEGISYNPEYLTWSGEGIGRYLVFFAIEGVLYFALVFVVDSDLFKKMIQGIRKVLCCRKKRLVYSETDKAINVEADEDVASERSRILDTPLQELNQTDALLIKDLKKVYSLRGGQGLVAVDGISVGVPLGECFGLLGVNGAGKTTTFKMLTGDETLTAGTAYLDGYSIKSDIKRVQQRMGYCPQFDALIDQMTGRETLTMYGRLRGVPEAYIPDEVNRLLKILTIDPHADKLTKTYSGGNKRKLSTAIALMGDPPIIFLDEPTTGMDPVARRLLWDTLSQIRASGKCIILTSHSMEECEALCTRLAIMVNGQFKCLGSVQHLKYRFGQGYTVLAKAQHGETLSNFKLLMEEMFPGSKLKDEHQGMVHYHITNTQLTWAQVFGAMERAKTSCGIKDYSVSQTTLEQVFLNFARMQREDSRR